MDDFKQKNLIFAQIKIKDELSINRQYFKGF